MAEKASVGALARKPKSVSSKGVACNWTVAIFDERFGDALPMCNYKVASKIPITYIQAMDIAINALYSRPALTFVRARIYEADAQGYVLNGDVFHEIVVDDVIPVEQE